MSEEAYGVAVIEYHDEESGLEYRWHGGAYVDISYGGVAPFDVLNVWDDKADLSVFEIEAEGRVRPFRDILEGFEVRCGSDAMDRMTEQDS